MTALHKAIIGATSALLFACATPTPTTTMPFGDVFKNNTDGSITPIKPFTIKGSGVTINGGSISKGTVLGGVDVLSLKDKTLVVEQQKNTNDTIVIVKGVSK